MRPPRLASAGPHPLDQGVAVLVRHADVGDQDVGLLLERGERLRRGGAGFHLGPALFEHRLEQMAGIRLVVDASTLIPLEIRRAVEDTAHSGRMDERRLLRSATGWLRDRSPAA